MIYLNMISNKKQKGFTLVETVVSLSIILILSAIILPRYSSLRYEFNLLRSGYKLSQDIRRAQEMATSAKQFNNSVPSGYGVYLSENDTSYIIYADINDNQRYGAGDQIVETINLNRKIYVKDISPSNSISINFKSPDPLTLISNNADFAIIDLGLEDRSDEKTVIVNKVGLIYVQE